MFWLVESLDHSASPGILINVAPERTQSRKSVLSDTLVTVWAVFYILPSISRPMDTNSSAFHLHCGFLKLTTLTKSLCHLCPYTIEPREFSGAFKLRYSTKPTPTPPLWGRDRRNCFHFSIVQKQCCCFPSSDIFLTGLKTFQRLLPENSVALLIVIQRLEGKMFRACPAVHLSHCTVLPLTFHHVKCQHYHDCFHSSSQVFIPFCLSVFRP